MAEALATKYRPAKFEDVTEQGSTKVILQQMLDSRDIAHALLFVGGAGTGKTTCARIFANEVNGETIELDAASHNGVDDVRDIIQQAKTKSLYGEYKVYIVDECVTGDTELLTDRGFVRFDALLGDELVAQYENDGSIHFVEPIRFIKKEYHDELVCWKPRNWCTVKMTKHHVQPLHYVKSDSIKEKYITDVKFSQSNDLIVSGKAVGYDNEFSPIDKLAIACQADGTFQNFNEHGTRWTIQLKKKRKIDRLLKLFEEGNVNFSEIKSTRPEVRRFGFDMPSNVSKLFSTRFHLDSMGYDRAKAFIEELQYWDGSDVDKYIYYGSTVKENTDFVSAVAPLAGYSARQTVKPDNRKDSYKNIHAVRLYPRQYSNCQYIQKTVTYEHYDGYVYCVEVPSHKIIVRAGGFVFITGNCHSISSAGWQAFLKILEEPPAKSIFIFCTTDMTKIPRTIISRVQRFDFKRISQQGIVNRLRYICDRELQKEDDLVRLEALEYIARIAEGGMRTAITYLDKVMSYTREITISNIITVLGTADYDVMQDLTTCIYDKNAERIIEIIEKLFDDGVDLKQFIRQYITFVLDIKKVWLTNSFEYAQLPETDSLKKFISERYNGEVLSHLLSTLVKLHAEIKYDTNPRSLIEVYLLKEVCE